MYAGHIASHASFVKCERGSSYVEQPIDEGFYGPEFCLRVLGMLLYGGVSWKEVGEVFRRCCLFWETEGINIVVLLLDCYPRLLFLLVENRV